MTGPRPRLIGLILTLLAGMLACGAPPDATGAGPKPSLLVSSFALGVAGAGGKIEVPEFAAALSAGGWCTAAPARAASRWNRRPDGAAPGSWISVVTAGFGTHAEAFVFMFDAPEDAARLLAHVPYERVWNGLAATWVWIPPTTALAEVAAAAYRRNPAPNQRPIVGYRAKEQAAAADSAAVTPDPGDPATAGATPAPGAATVTADEALPPLEAMLCAALCANGLAPAWNARDQTLTLAAHFGFRASSLQLLRQGSGRPGRIVKDKASEEQYYGYLRRMVWNLLATEALAPRDFLWLGPGPAQLLAASGTRVAALTGGSLAAHDPVTGQRAWPPATAKSLSATYAGGAADAVAARRLYRCSGGLAAVALDTGTEQALAAEAPSAPWGFACQPTGLAVVARGQALTAWKAGTRLWRQEETAEITAGPLLAGDAVVFGTTTGVAVCRALDTGAEKWRRPAAERLRGEMVLVDGRILAFDQAGDSLLALNAADGARLWQQPLGDVLLKAPVPLGGKLLVATKGNRLALLEPATGQLLREVTWPTWLVDVLPVTRGDRTVIACTDIRRQLVFLDAASLDRRHGLALPARPSGSLLYVPAFPLAWGIEDATAAAGPAADSLPALLVSDVEGFLYVLPAP